MYDILFLLLSLVHIRDICCLETGAPSGTERGTEQIITRESEPKRYDVISEYSIAALLYPGIRITKSYSPMETSLIDPEIKAQICRNIIGNDFFVSREHEVYEGPSETETGQEGVNEGSVVDIHPDKKLDVFVFGLNKSFEEIGFICPSHNRKTEKIVEYFVSQEYNVGFLSRSYIGARFIFQPIYYPHLYVVAEQSAEAEFLDNIELYYLGLKEKNERAMFVSADPLRKLDQEEMKRICLSVFNASRFDPHQDGIGLLRKDLYIHIQDRTISFQTEEGKYEALGMQIHQFREDNPLPVRKEFKEWTVGCEKNAKFLLSQAYENDRVLVYFLDQSTDKLYPDTLMGRLRFKRT